MARYNTVSSTNSIAGGNTITTPYSGLLTTLTGSGTVTIPNPTLYTGQTQTYYNSTGSAITLSTPSGSFVGSGASGNNSQPLAASAVITLVSDGTNYIVQDWLGGAANATTLSASTSVTLSPTGTVVINPTTLSSINNVNIGASTAGTGAFTNLSASATSYFTSNVGFGTSSPAAKLDVVDGGVYALRAQSIPILGTPGGGTYAGYLLLAKAYTSGNVAQSWVMGTFYIKRGSTVSGNRTDSWTVSSNSAYQNEDLTVQVVANASQQFVSTVKVTYSGTVYHAIQTTSTGGNPDNGVWFTGTYYNCTPTYVDASYVSNITGFSSAVSVFNSSGNLGIGTVNPTTPLHITVSNANPYNTVQTVMTLTQSGGNQGSGTQINFTQGSGTNFIQSVVTGANSATGSALLFGTANTGSLGSERMRIDANGNVCIGYTSTQSPNGLTNIMSVNGNAYFNGTVYAQIAQEGYQMPQLSSQWIRLGTLHTGQQGYWFSMKIFSDNGWNATTNQNQITEIYFKTSNTSSNVAGFYGDCYAISMLPSGTTSAPSSIIVKQTTDYNTFEFWAYFNFTSYGTYFTYSLTPGTYFTVDASTTTGTTAPTGTITTVTPQQNIVANSQVPGFTAWVATGLASNFSSGSTMKFETTNHNVGGSYNTGTSTFTAPVTGRYLVNCTCSPGNWSGTDIWIALNPRVNGSYYQSSNQSLGAGMTSPPNNNQYICLTWNGVISLNANDTLNFNLTYNTFNGNVGYGVFSVQLIG